MKKIIFVFIASFVFSYSFGQSIKLSNTHSADATGYHLHNGAFGSFFNPGPTIAKIVHVEASSRIESWNLMQSPHLVVDFNNKSTSQPVLNSTTWNNSLQFGSGSGEGITSKRNDGSGQYGLDFYTGFLNRLHINSDGSVGFGTTNGNLPTIANAFTRVHIDNKVQATDTRFKKRINLLTTAVYNDNENGIGIKNYLSSSPNSVNLNNINTFYTDINYLYPGNITPLYATSGINNNLKDFTATQRIANGSLYSPTYGIFNDLNNGQPAAFGVQEPGSPLQMRYQPRIGILSVTNTQNNSTNSIPSGSGKIAAWFINMGGSTTPSSNGLYPVIDGWAIWADGNVFMRNSPAILSDDNYKTLKKELNSKEILNNLLKIKTYSYELKDSKGIKENGVIAQQLKDIFPEMVVKAINPATNTEILTVQYNQFHSIVITAIQEQQKTIESLVSKITQLEEIIKKNK